MNESTRLAQRLELGWAKIDEAREANDLIREQQWTDHWLELEAQYRAAFDTEHHQTMTQEPLLA